MKNKTTRTEWQKIKPGDVVGLHGAEEFVRSVPKNFYEVLEVVPVRVKQPHKFMTSHAMMRVTFKGSKELNPYDFTRHMSAWETVHVLKFGDGPPLDWRLFRGIL